MDELFIIAVHYLLFFIPKSLKQMEGREGKEWKEKGTKRKEVEKGRVGPPKRLASDAIRGTAPSYRYSQTRSSLPKRAIIFLTKLFNAVLCRLYFPPAWKHVRVASILKPGKDPRKHLPFSPISLL
jgi:hypothetical protein